MRVERTTCISSALPLREERITQPSHSSRSNQQQASTPSRSLEDIAMLFNMRDMDTGQALQLANRLLEEELVTSPAHYCLTGVPMTLIPGEGYMPSHGAASTSQRFDYIREFELYVALEPSQNVGAVELLQTVLNVLGFLDTLRRHGPVNISA